VWKPYYFTSSVLVAWTTVGQRPSRPARLWSESVWASNLKIKKQTSPKRISTPITFYSVLLYSRINIINIYVYTYYTIHRAQRHDTRNRFISRRLQNLSYSLRPTIRQTNNNNIYGWIEILECIKYNILLFAATDDIVILSSSTWNKRIYVMRFV